jgi:hypothetical protein
MEPIVELAPGTEDHGLAGMLAGLVRQNLDDHQSKRPAFHRLAGRVAIVADDADAAVTLHFGGGRLTVHEGIVGIPDLTIRAPTEDITRLSSLEMLGLLGDRWAIPDPRGEVTREIVRRSMARRIQVHGLLANLPLMLRLARVMSVS